MQEKLEKGVDFHSTICVPNKNEHTMNLGGKNSFELLNVMNTK